MYYDYAPRQHESVDNLLRHIYWDIIYKMDDNSNYIYTEEEILANIFWAIKHSDSSRWIGPFGYSYVVEAIWEIVTISQLKVIRDGLPSLGISFIKIISTLIEGYLNMDGAKEG